MMCPHPARSFLSVSLRPRHLTMFLIRARVIAVLVAVLFLPCVLTAQSGGLPRGKRPYPYKCTWSGVEFVQDLACQIHCSAISGLGFGALLSNPFLAADLNPRFQCSPFVQVWIRWERGFEESDRSALLASVEYVRAKLDEIIKSRNRNVPVHVAYLRADLELPGNVHLNERVKALYVMGQHGPEVYQSIFQAHGKKMLDATAQQLADPRLVSQLPLAEIKAGRAAGAANWDEKTKDGVVAVINVERAMRENNPAYLRNVLLHETLHLFGLIHPAQPNANRPTSVTDKDVSVSDRELGWAPGTGVIVEQHLNLGPDEGK